MEKFNEYMEGFRLNYEKFLIGCDALEEEGSWPLVELGQMEGYFSNDLMCVAMRLFAADGIFTETEVRALNRLFDSDYTVEELAEIYGDCREKISGLTGSELNQSIAMLEDLEPGLADLYGQLLRMLVNIAVESDGFTSEDEKAEVMEMFAFLG